MPKQKPDHISQEDWDAVDSPPLTEAMIRNMKPSRERMPPHVFEKLVRAYEARQAEAENEEVTLSLGRDVVEHFKSRGPDWRKRMRAALEQAAALEK